MTAAYTIPVSVLTGYLGSGKTTLLQRLLDSPAGAGAAVLINEFGEIGLDHLLVRPMSGPAVVLQNGCICCTVRSDLRSGLRDLIDARDKGEIPAFDRILVETTGLADPVPIVQTLVTDPMLRHQMHLANLISTVDGRNAMSQLSSYREAMRQVALSDRLALTKGDLCEEEGIASLRTKLYELNPTATLVDTRHCNDIWKALLGTDADDVFQGYQRTIERLSVHEAGLNSNVARAGSEGASRHDHTIRSFAVRTDRTIDWTAFAVWLSALVHRHGSKLLRVKGLLNVQGADGPLVLNAVQSFVHPPVHLHEWPTEDHSSRLIFIVDGLDPALVRMSLARTLDGAAATSGTVRVLA